MAPIPPPRTTATTARPTCLPPTGIRPTGVQRAGTRPTVQPTGTRPAGARRAGADRGSTTVEMVGYGAVMLLALLVGVQAAAWGLAQLACRYAANHALQVTRVQGGTVDAGQVDATATLRQIDAALVTGASAHATRDATTATVTVAGDAIQIVPLLRLRVGATASGPVEVLGP